MTGSDRKRSPTHASSARRSSLGIPMNEEAEWALTASVLVDPESAKDSCLDMIDEEMFTHPGLRDLIVTVRELLEEGTDPDPVVLEPLLHQTLTMEDLTRLYFEIVPSGANIMTHYHAVLEAHRQRKYWYAAQKVVMGIGSKDFQSSDVRLHLEQAIDEVERSGYVPKIKSVREVLPKTMEEIKPATERDPNELVQTGLYDLDNILVGGLRGGQLYILAARPSMGKTTLAMNIAENMAVEGHAPLVVSLETRSTTLVQGLLARSSGVNGYHLLRGTYREMDALRIKEARQEVEDLPLYLCDESYVTVPALRTMARAARNKHQIKAVVIDYLQLMEADGRAESRQVQVSQMSRGIKLMAMELNLPVILLSQLSRKTEGRESKKPLLSDLRESGSIEQDADAVLLLFRPGYYDRSQDQSLTEVIVAKQRHGPVGTVPLKFHPEVGEFTQWEELEQT